MKNIFLFIIALIVSIGCSKKDYVSVDDISHTQAMSLEGNIRSITETIYEDKLSSNGFTPRGKYEYSFFGVNASMYLLTGETYSETYRYINHIVDGKILKHLLPYSDISIGVTDVVYEFSEGGNITKIIHKNDTRTGKVKKFEYDNGNISKIITETLYPAEDLAGTLSSVSTETFDYDKNNLLVKYQENTIFTYRNKEQTKNETIALYTYQFNGDEITGSVEKNTNGIKENIENFKILQGIDDVRTFSTENHTIKFQGIHLLTSETMKNGKITSSKENVYQNSQLMEEKSSYGGTYSYNYNETIIDFFTSKKDGETKKFLLSYNRDSNNNWTTLTITDEKSEEGIRRYKEYNEKIMERKYNNPYNYGYDFADSIIGSSNEEVIQAEPIMSMEEAMYNLETKMIEVNREALNGSYLQYRVVRQILYY